MSLLKEIFGVEKPLIGVVHLLPLPGSPRWNYSMEKVLERALQDAEAYEKGGFDGIIIENYGDAPYYPDKVDPATVAAITRVATLIAEKIEIPFGINVLRNDAEAALAIAYVTGGRFIRVNVLTEPVAADQGIIQGKAHILQRYRKLLGADQVKIFADVHVKHAYPLMKRPITESAKDTVYRGLADALIVTGRKTGSPPSPIKAEKVKKAVPQVPVLVGSGVNENNIIQYLQVCDGVIVGTSLKIDNKTENPVDLNKVKKLVKKANQVR